MATLTQDLHRARGSKRVRRIAVVNAATLAANASNYWTIDVYRVRPGETYGRKIASFSTSRLTLTANKAATFYDVEQGEILEDDDVLRSKAISTGSPAALTNAAVMVQFSRS